MQPHCSGDSFKTTAGGLTVGKLYLVDASDATNKSRIFSNIGVAMGSGAICGPALGGLLANYVPASWFQPMPSALGALVLRHPYLAPCAAAAAAAAAISVLAMALSAALLVETVDCSKGAVGEASLSAAL